MIRHHLGPLLNVWIMQVSLFSSVLINRFHCNIMNLAYRVIFEAENFRGYSSMIDFVN